MPTELRFAFRQLVASPGFSALAVLGLALGIGANVALFSVVNAVFLRPLPYPEADRLVRLASTDADRQLIRVGFSYPRFLEVQARQHVFSDLALSAANAFTLTGRGDPQQIVGLQASATLLPTLGLQPLLGRNFSADEDRPGGEPVALIGTAAWQRFFNRDPGVLGQTLTLDGRPHTVIGVLPEAATAFPLDPFQVWVARPTEVPYLVPAQLDNGGFFFQAIGRLRPGVTVAQAADAMAVVASGYREAHPANVDAASTLGLVPLLDDAVGAQRQSYLLLLGAVGCVLLIACANIANLLLARFAGRRREIAARFALGASRLDVIRQLVTESVVVAGLGGLAGVVLAWWALQGLVTLGADLIPRALEIGLDPWALGFAVALTLATGLAIGLVPALQASSVDVLESLKDASRGSTSGGGRRLRATLLVAEVSLSIVLLVAAGLLLRSFVRLQAVEPGFEPGGVFTAQIVLPARYDQPATVTFYERLFRELSALPSGAAALTDRVPLTGNQTPAPVAVVGRPIPPMSERPQANRHLVSPRYFATLGIPLRAGRDFDERDSASAPQVVIINETFARRHFPGEDPIGRTLMTGMGQRQAQVVGVVADVRSTGLETPPEADYFLPALQRPEAFTNILVDTTLGPAAMTPLVREVLRRADPELPLLEPQMLTTRIGATLANRRLALVLLGLLAALALVLACLGVYSVMAHLVVFRTGEIGIRMALGATPTSVMRLVLGHGRRLTLLGIALGLAAAAGVTRLLRQTLFEVDAFDPLVYAGVSLVLLLVAESASWVPARRATRIDPVIALRSE